MQYRLDTFEYIIIRNSITTSRNGSTSTIGEYTIVILFKFMPLPYIGSTCYIENLSLCELVVTMLTAPPHIRIKFMLLHP